jgi:hypothetical protein
MENVRAWTQISRSRALSHLLPGGGQTCKGDEKGYTFGSKALTFVI